MNFISCGTWIKRGVAKCRPDMVQLNTEELQQIIQDTKTGLSDLDEDDRGAKKKKITEEESGDPVAEYDLENYDKEDELSCGFGNMPVILSDTEDPYITIKEKDYVDSDEEDFEIHPSDNLIVVGHVESDASSLEVYVCNPDEGYLYVHHDIMLSSLPLCVEWLNHDPGESSPGNLVAVGSMSSVIEIWDIDVVNCLQPAYKLGKKPSKKKNTPRVGHKDAVLSLAWNSHFGHILASGSADETLLLWDLDNGTVASQLGSHKEKVQSLHWHLQEAHTLLTGCTDGMVYLYDFRTENNEKTWKVHGEVEKVLWNHFNPDCFLVSTETGQVCCIDSRKEKSVWTLDAHNGAVQGIALSSQCPGCLLTVSSDKLLKLWDIKDGKPEYITEKNLKIGELSFVAACPDSPFTFCMGGDNRKSNFYVWDVSSDNLGWNRFQNLQTKQTDVSSAEVDVAMETEAAAEMEALSLSSKSKKSKKLEADKTKSKKGHLLKQKKKKKKDHVKHKTEKE